MSSHKKTRAFLLQSVLCLFAILLLLSGCGQKSYGPITSDAEAPIGTAALDVARNYVTAISAGDKKMAAQLSFLDNYYSFSEQAQKVFNLSTASAVTSLKEVTVDNIKVLSTSQEYFDALNDTGSLAVGSPEGLTKMKDFVKRRFDVQKVKQVEFLTLTTHEVKNPQEVHQAYVTILRGNKGKWYAAPGINFLGQ